MRPQPYPRLGQTQLLVVLGILLIILLLRSSLGGAFTTAISPTDWNTQVIDVARNRNAILSLNLLETKSSPTPINVVARDVLASPSKYFGRYLQLSGTIQSVQTYPVQNNLPGLIMGNTCELVMIASDGMTLINCLLINAGIIPTIGSNITINGYTPGIRYIQNSQTFTQELVIIGYLV